MSGRIREEMNGKECKCDDQTHVGGITVYTFFRKNFIFCKSHLLCFLLRISHSFFDLKLLNQYNMATFIKKMPTFSNFLFLLKNVIFGVFVVAEHESTICFAVKNIYEVLFLLRCITKMQTLKTTKMTFSENKIFRKKGRKKWTYMAVIPMLDTFASTKTAPKIEELFHIFRREKLSPLWNFCKWTAKQGCPGANPNSCKFRKTKFEIRRLRIANRIANFENESKFARSNLVSFCVSNFE